MATYFGISIIHVPPLRLVVHKKENRLFQLEKLEKLKRTFCDQIIFLIYIIGNAPLLLDPFTMPFCKKLTSFLGPSLKKQASLAIYYLALFINHVSQCTFKTSSFGHTEHTFLQQKSLFSRHLDFIIYCVLPALLRLHTTKFLMLSVFMLS
jgi:hypothetical protein